MKNSTGTDWICSKFKWASNKAMAIINISDSTGIDRETIIEVLKDNDLYVRKDQCTICGKTFKRYIKPMCQDCIDRTSALADRRAEKKRQTEWEIMQLEVRRWSLLRKLADFDRTIQAKKEIVERLKIDKTYAG